jgi:hypothetical protein
MRLSAIAPKRPHGMGITIYAVPQFTVLLRGRKPEPGGKPGSITVVLLFNGQD